MCQMWMVKRTDGSELMFPSDEQLLELLKNDSKVVMVYEKFSGKALVDKRPENSSLITKLFPKLIK